MMMASQIALFKSTHMMNPLNTLNIMTTSIQQSLFLSDAEIDSFMLLDLDVDSMNESIDIDFSG